MLPRRYRVGKEYFSQKKNGKRFTSPHFSLETSSAVRPQFSVVVSAKVAKKAVGRNKLKRRVYDMCGSTLPLLKTPRVAIIYARAGAADLPYQTIKNEITHLFKISGTI